MQGALWTPGVATIRPGTYLRATSLVTPVPVLVQQGIVAAVGVATWGPTAAVVTIENYAGIADALGASGSLVELAQQAFLAGADKVQAARLDGTGGAVGTRTLQDTTGTPINVVTLTTKYKTSRSFTVTVRDSLTDPTNTRELVVYEGTTQLLATPFTKGATGIGEPQQLVNAIAAGHPYFAAVKLADGNKILAAVSQVAVTGGADPTPASTDYTTAQSALEMQPWNVLVTDSVDATQAIPLASQAYIDRIRNDGKRRMFATAQPVTVALATRLANAAAYNDPAVVYIGNGFTIGGVNYDGYKAAARVAGHIASNPVTVGMTKQIITGATAPYNAANELTDTQIKQAIQNGMAVFTANSLGQVWVEYGIDTLVTPGAGVDSGWKKIRRVRTRDNLWERIAASWDPMRVNNDENGRAALVATAQAVVNDMISEGALAAGTAIVDPNYVSSGDSVYVAVQNIVDLDGADKVYGTLQFQF